MFFVFYSLFFADFLLCCLTYGHILQYQYQNGNNIFLKKNHCIDGLFRLYDLYFCFFCQIHTIQNPTFVTTTKKAPLSRVLYSFLHQLQSAKVYQTRHRVIKLCFCFRCIVTQNYNRYFI